MRIYKVIFLFISITLLASGMACTPKPTETIRKKVTANQYDSAFPGKNDSKALVRIMKSVKRVNSTVYYSTYVYSQDKRLTSDKIDKINIRKYADKVVNTNQSTSGTATIIYKDKNNIALLTCAHILTFPDTVVTYYKRGYVSDMQYVRSISIKRRQVNLLLALPDLGYFKILAMDQKADIALLGARVDQFSNINIPVLDIPIGDPSKLEWASFVYVLGYPQGYKMITRALVSEPDRDVHDSFIMDALFNKGFSGGLVLAIKGGVPNFEWVGMANSATAKYEYFLKPDISVVDKYDEYTPYTDPIYIEHRSQIEYGITHAISVNRIKYFFKNDIQELRKEGYDFRIFLK